MQTNNNHLGFKKGTIQPIEIIVKTYDCRSVKKCHQWNQCQIRMTQETGSAF